jgi:hypothetical protein
MAESIINPVNGAGVYTNEKDQSFLPLAIQEIGAAIVGPTVKGRVMTPTTVSSNEEFRRLFGPYTDDSYVPFVVDNYLQSGNNITVTRILYENGYNLADGVLAVLAKSGSGASAVEVVTHILHPVEAVNEAAELFKSSSIADDASGVFAISLSGSYTANLNTDVPGFSGAFDLYPTTNTPVSASIVQADNNYLSKVFGTNPKGKDYPVYVQYENQLVSSLFNSMADVSVELAVLPTYDFSYDYSTANTPWVTSQKIGSTPVNLFKFHTLSHGNTANIDVKVGIKDVRLSTETSDPFNYGSFTVEVRKVNQDNASTVYKPIIDSDDTDTDPDVVETFSNVNLNPNSARFIARVIGNQYREFNGTNIITYGDYENQSEYIRVEITDSVLNGIDSTLVPFGFRAPLSSIPTVSGSLNFASASYVTSQSDYSYSFKNYHGFDFVDTNNNVYIASTPDTAAQTTGSNADFYLGDVSQSIDVAFPLGAAYTGSLQSSLSAGTFASKVAVSTRKFIMPMQGGFDGARPNLPKFSGGNIKASNTFGFDCELATSTGTTTYQNAFALLSNTDYYDMNMLITPGIIDSLHGTVSAAARNLARDRQDTFYINDLVGLEDNISTVISQANGIDNNYVATYYPWVKIKNPQNQKPMWVPPSVVLPGVISYNDFVKAPWYAPAGLQRGGLSVDDTYIALNPTQRGELYNARINPIANLATLGIAVWGQKTLQAVPSALDRVNVRRLLIATKKFIASATQFLVFDQNTDQTRIQFLNIVNPYLASVKQQQGLYAFRVIMDGTNNTNDLIDQNIMYGQLFLQPTKTAEFIVLDFNIQPTGAAFPE